MVGICGSIGGTLPSRMTESLAWKGTESVHQYRDGNVEIAVATHSGNATKQPVETSDGTRFFLWGEVYGHEDRRYKPRVQTDPSLTKLEYCAALYEEHGTEFVNGLNGEFTMVWHHPETNTLSVATNRLGTHPLYHLSSGSGVWFGPHIQPLALSRNTPPSFSPEYLYEFFSFRRSFGCRTPVEGVEMFHPGAVTTYDTSTKQMITEVYWFPEFKPRKERYNHFADRFVELIHTIVNEHLERSSESGVMLSGGTDSRAIVAAADSPVTGIHVTDWPESKETKIAKEIAEMSGNDIRIFERDLAYHRNAVAKNPTWSNFNSWFNQAHALGFAEEISSEIDHALLGLYSDAIFSLSYYPRLRAAMPGIGKFHLPVGKNVDSIDEYVDHHLEGYFDRKFTGQPEYLKKPPRLQEILKRNIRNDEHVTHHGVKYPSLQELLTSMYYPATNLMSFFFYETMVQTLPCNIPFFDNRLIDLHLQMPVQYHLRRDIVRDSIQRHNPNLTRIQHANVDFPLHYPKPVQFAGRFLTKLRRERFEANSPPEEYLRNEGWGIDHADLIRQTDIVKRSLKEKSELIDYFPFLDPKGIKETYHNHLNDGDRHSALYTLMTFLHTPLTNAIFENQTKTT